MSEELKSEVISRRRALSLLGLAAAFSLAAPPLLLTVSDAEAQQAVNPEGDKPTPGEKTGVERRQERRSHRRERRHERRSHRRERRHERRSHRRERREERRSHRRERREERDTGSEQSK